MGIEIPDELQWVAKYLLGAGDWPDGDETAMRRVADGWTAMATSLDAIDDEAAKALGSALSAITEGETHTSISNMRDKLLVGDEATFLAVRRWCTTQAEILNDGANDIEHTKLVIIGTMIITAVEILATAWTGVGLIASAAVRIAAQVTIRIAIKQLIARMLTRGAAKAAARLALRGAAFEALEEGGTDLSARLIQVYNGDRSMTKFGWTDLGLATFGGAVGGAVGGVLGGGTGALGDVASSTAGKMAGKVVGGAVTELGADVSAQVAAAGVGAAFLGQEFKLDIGVDTFTSAGAGGVHSALESGSHGGTTAAPTVPDVGSEIPSATSPAQTDVPSDSPTTPQSENGNPATPSDPDSDDGGGPTAPASTAQPDDGATTPQTAQPDTAGGAPSTPSPADSGSTESPSPGETTSPGDSSSAPSNTDGSPPATAPDETSPAPNDVSDNEVPSTPRDSPSNPGSAVTPDVSTTDHSTPSTPPPSDLPTTPPETPSDPGSSLDLPTQETPAPSTTPPKEPSNVQPSTDSPDNPGQPTTSTAAPQHHPTTSDEALPPATSTSPVATDPHEVTSAPPTNLTAGSPQQPLSTTAGPGVGTTPVPTPLTPNPSPPASTDTTTAAVAAAPTAQSNSLPPAATSSQPAQPPTVSATPTPTISPTPLPTTPSRRPSTNPPVAPTTTAGTQPIPPSVAPTPSTSQMASMPPAQTGGAVRPRNIYDVDAQDAWAEVVYDHIRSTDADLDRIVAGLAETRRANGSVGFTRAEIEQIKNHLFREVHPLTRYDEEGHDIGVELRRYEADADIAEAWMRMAFGRAEDEDITLLEHELAEAEYYERYPESSYRDAHQYANSLFPWETNPHRPTGENINEWRAAYGGISGLSAGVGDRSGSDVPIRECGPQARSDPDDQQGGLLSDSDGRQVRQAGSQDSRHGDEQTPPGRRLDEDGQLSGLNNRPPRQSGGRNETPDAGQHPVTARTDSPLPPSRSSITPEQSQNANQARIARDHLRSQQADGGSRAVSGSNGERRFTWHRYISALGAPVSVLRIGVSFTGAEHLDPADRAALIEGIQLAVDHIFNGGYRLPNGDWVMIDISPVTDPADADMQMSIDGPTSPAPTNPGIEPSEIIAQVRGQLGLEPTTSQQLSPADLREVGAAIDRAAFAPPAPPWPAATASRTPASPVAAHHSQPQPVRPADLRAPASAPPPHSPNLNPQPPASNTPLGPDRLDVTPNAQPDNHPWGVPNPNHQQSTGTRRPLWRRLFGLPPRDRVPDSEPVAEHGSQPPAAATTQTSPDYDSSPPTDFAEFGATPYSTSPPFQTQQMQRQYEGEHLPGNHQWRGVGAEQVEYLSHEQRQQRRVTILNGVIYAAPNVPFDTRSGSSAWGGSGRAVFVMDQDGNLYVSNTHEPGTFHHSSFLAGQPVAAAGELVVIDGILQLLTDSSGHYRPERGHTLQAINHLRSLGVIIEPSQVRLEAPPQ